MSLLADLNLSYEILADDPIEMGIRYGKSILGVVSDKLSDSTAVYETANYVRRTLPTQVSEFRSQLVRTPVLAEARVQPSIERRNFNNFSSRSVATATRPVYAERSLIGVI